MINEALFGKTSVLAGSDIGVFFKYARKIGNIVEAAISRNLSDRFIFGDQFLFGTVDS